MHKCKLIDGEYRCIVKCENRVFDFDSCEYARGFSGKYFCDFTDNPQGICTKIAAVESCKMDNGPVKYKHPSRMSKIGRPVERIKRKRLSTRKVRKKMGG